MNDLATTAFGVLTVLTAGVLAAFDALPVLDHGARGVGAVVSLLAELL